MRAAKDPSPEALLRLFEAAFNTLWVRTNSTLGEVTLLAIAERVLHNAAQRFKPFASLSVDPVGGIECGELAEQVGSLEADALREGIRFVLVEFLTVLGNLTAQILTAELHAELSKVSQPKAGRARREPRVPSAAVDIEGEDDRQ